MRGFLITIFVITFIYSESLAQISIYGPFVFLGRDVDHITLSDSVKKIKEWKIQFDSTGMKTDTSLKAEYFFAQGRCIKILDYDRNREITFSYDETFGLIGQKYNRITDGIFEHFFVYDCETMFYDKEEKNFSRTLSGIHLEKKIYINSEQNCMVEQKYYYKQNYCTSKEIYILGKLTKKIIIEYYFK